MSFELPSGPPDRPLRGILYMVLGITFFSVVDGLSKWMVLAMPALQIVALRNACILALITPAVARGGGVRALHTRRPWAHVLRALLSIGALLTFFEALRALPLATSIAIGFVSPLFMTAASVILLRERVGAHRWAAVALGFLGVLIIAWPEPGRFVSTPALLMVLSSLFFALAMTTVRWLARTETDVAMLFYQNLGMMLAGVAALPFVWRTPTVADLLAVAVTAVALVIGQVCMIRAFRAAAVAVVAPFEYTELLWTTLIGYVVWSELPASRVWAGAFVLVASGLYIIWRESLATRRTERPDLAAKPHP